MYIRPYDPQRDEDEVYGLWQRTLEYLWPITRPTFHYITVANEAYQAKDHFVAEVNGTFVGFVGTQTRISPGTLEPHGELMVIMVDSAYQRKGIGRTLLDQALVSLKERSVVAVQLGAGGLCYFWAGVPTNLPGAWSFFEKCGWSEKERSFDLARKLDNYVTPLGGYERVRLPSITIAAAEPEDISAVLAFEAQHFAKWLRYFQMVVEHNDYADIVLARDSRGEIIGTSFVIDPRAAWRQGDIVWKELLGANIGGVGPLGVVEDKRENGIGLALAARVTELLRARGIAASYIGYTWLVDWYGKLGYKIWREYIMSWKTL